MRLSTEDKCGCRFFFLSLSLSPSLFLSFSCSRSLEFIALTENPLYKKGLRNVTFKQCLLTLQPPFVSTFQKFWNLFVDYTIPNTLVSRNQHHTLLPKHHQMATLYIFPRLLALFTPTAQHPTGRTGAYWYENRKLNGNGNENGNWIDECYRNFHFFIHIFYASTPTSTEHRDNRKREGCLRSTECCKPASMHAYMT